MSPEHIAHIKGIVIFEGQNFHFGASKGYGLVTSNGRTALISFDCKSETMPPQGYASEVKNESGLRIDDSRGLLFADEPVLLTV